MIRLSQEFGAHTGRQLTFDQDRVRLGRAPSNEVSFDPNVDLDASGNHCEIAREQGGYVVVDLGSRNGTYVNGQRVMQRQRLAHGDVVECGRGGPRLRVDLGGAPAGMGNVPPGGGGVTPPMGGMGPFVPQPPAPLGGMGPAHGTQPPGGGLGGGPFGPVGNTPPPGHPYGGPQGFGGATPPPAGNPHPYGTTPPPPLGASPGYGSVPAPPMHVGGPPPGFNPMPPAGPHGGGAPMGYPSGPGPTGGPSPGSVGAAVAAALPPGAQVGKRTVAMMIDQAIARSSPKRSTAGLKIAMVATVLLVIAGLSVGGYLLWADREDRDSRVAGTDSDGAGERISTQYEAAIYMLAQMRPGTPRPQGFCTAFAVTQDLLATNAHCVQVAREMMGRGASIVALRNNGRGAQTPVQPVYQDPRFRDPNQGLEGSGFDVGLVRAAMPLPTAVRLASADEVMRMRAGAHIYVYGFPGMTMNEVSPVATITEGLLNRSTDFFDRAADPPVAQKVQHTAQTTSGSSGSPIFLANGTVIAINAGSLADEERQNILDPRTGQRVNVEVNRSSNFKYGMRADLIRQAIQQVGENAP